METKPSKRKLSRIFGKFAGKDISSAEPLKNPLLEEMNKVAKENGLVLRVWFNNSVGTTDARNDRVNVRVVQGAKGTYRIGRNFYIG